MFVAEMRAAGFVAGEGVETHQLREFQKIGHASGAFERLIELFAIAGHADPAVAGPESFAQIGNFSECFFQPVFISRHSAFVPKERAELAMDRIKRALSVYLEKIVDLGADIAFRLLEFSVIVRRPLAHLSSEVIGKRVRQNEVTIGQTLHEGAGAEPVRSVIREIRFADHEQSRNVAHQVVVNPKPAHGVMDRGINSHWELVGVLASDLLVNLEQIPVAFADRFFAKSLDRVGKIEINAAPTRTDPSTFVANRLGPARSNSPPPKVPVTRIF